MKTALLTDSTCDIPRDLRQEIDFLKIIPLKIHFEEESFVDGKDISPERFFARIKKTGEIPSTSQPSAGEFLQIYDMLGAEYDRIISLHISGELSGTISSARTAAQQIEGTDIEIFDTGTTSLGLGFMVLKTAEMIAKNRGWEEIKDRLEHMQKNTVLYFTVDDLTYLQKGGRIGRAQALLGSILNFQPLLTVPADEGEVIPRGKARGKKRLNKKIIQQVEEILQAEDEACLGILNGGIQENGVELENDLKNLLEEKKVNYSLLENTISPVLGCHTGPTVYGAAFVSGDKLKRL